MKAAEFFDGNTGRRLAFLQRIGWADAIATLVSEDMASRRYWRLVRGEHTRLLMESVPDSSPFSTPGHKQSDFIRIGARLMEAGLSTPAVYDGDLEQGFLWLEDFGTTTLAQCRQQDPYDLTPHNMAIDALAVMKGLSDVQAQDLPRYGDSYVHTARRRLVDWWIPFSRQCPNDATFLPAYLEAWDHIMRAANDQVGPCPLAFMHVDYHAENLMWLPDRDDVRRCGILDFQAAMWGPRDYDLGNLVEDPRHPLPDVLAEKLRTRFWQRLDPSAQAVARLWYRIYVTQFHARVMGQYIKLACQGKTRYLAYLPQAQAYVRLALAHPILAPMRDFFIRNRIDLDRVPVFDAAQRNWVAADAF